MDLMPFSTRNQGGPDEEQPQYGLLGGGDGGGIQGLLGGMGSKFADNSNLMMALGMGLMSSPSNNPGEHLMQGMSVGGTMDARAQKARQEAMEKAAKQKAYREWAIANGKDPNEANLVGTDTELGRQIAADRMKTPSFQERLYSGLPEGQKAEATNALLGISKQPGGWEPITEKTEDGERTKGYYNKRTGQSISNAQMNQMLGGAASEDDTQTAGRGKLSPGYRWSQANPRVAEPIPGTKGDHDSTIPAEVAGRVGLGDVFLQKHYPGLKDKVASGDLTGIWDSSKAVNGVGEQGKLYADWESGVDALRRGLTGAGMPQSEADDYARRYLPTWKDTAWSASQKLERLKTELESQRSKIMQGREPRSSAPSADGWKDMGGGVKIKRLGD